MSSDLNDQDNTLIFSFLVSGKHPGVFLCLTLPLQEVQMFSRPSTFCLPETGVEKRFKFKSHLLRIFGVHLSSFTKDNYMIEHVYIYIGVKQENCYR
jgi:hypothetical protein